VGGSDPNLYKFTGYERDLETGHSYAIFRFHHEGLARFLTPDPLAGSVANPQSLNRYAYVLNDPMNWVDPLGLCPTDYIWDERTQSCKRPTSEDLEARNRDGGSRPAQGCDVHLGNLTLHFYACPSPGRIRRIREWWERIKKVNQCAAGAAFSVTEWLGIEPNSLTDVFVTANSASAISNVLTAPENVFKEFKETASFLGLYVFGPQPNITTATANIVGQIPINTTVTTTENLGSSIGTVTRTTEPVIGQTTAGTVARSIGAFFTIKFALFDTPAYLSAVADCSKQVE
jgi:RHS repeat-associated protein